MKAMESEAVRQERAYGSKTAQCTGTILKVTQEQKWGSDVPA